MIRTNFDSSLQLSSPGFAPRLELFGWQETDAGLEAHAFACHVRTPADEVLFEVVNGELNPEAAFVVHEVDGGSRDANLSAEDDALQWKPITLRRIEHATNQSSTKKTRSQNQREKRAGQRAPRQKKHRVSRG